MRLPSRSTAQKFHPGSALLPLTATAEADSEPYTSPLSSRRPSGCSFARAFRSALRTGYSPSPGSSGWHGPALFDMAMRSERWHAVEHAWFFAAGILFWWPVVQPWPSLARWPRWSVPLYLFLATLPCDALSAFLAFCGRVVYPHYLSAHRLFDISPLADQECAGALMWVWVTFAYLGPAAFVTVQLLSPQRRAFDVEVV